MKAYWRAKRWADLARAPLRILQGTLRVLVTATDWSSVTKLAERSLLDAESIAEFTGIGMMLHGLWEAGGKLHVAVQGPPYVAEVDAMLKAADATHMPLSLFEIDPYKKVILNRLNSPEDSPLRILRKGSPTGTPEVLNGALQVKTAILSTYHELIAHIEKMTLPTTFPIREVVAHLKHLEVMLKSSAVKPTTTSYLLVQEGGAREGEVDLGVPASLHEAFRVIAGVLAEDLRLQQTVEWLSVVGATGDVLQLSVAYVISGKEGVKIVQQVETLGKLIVKGCKVFHKDPEEEFYLLPQAMLHSLPG